jgi:uncharacterized protein
MSILRFKDNLPQSSSLCRHFVVFVLTILIGCSSYKDIIKEVETDFYSNRYDEAIPKIRSLAGDASNKDRLLYLMEAGIIFHTKGDYKTSNIVLQQAEDIADTIQKSMSREALSFILSDEETNFRGESFEVVMIKFYIALNMIMMSDLEGAKRYFKKVEFELKEMRFSEEFFQQNLAARYTNALVSEYLGNYNDARVQYKNILSINSDLKQVRGDRYVLAVKENDLEDIGNFADGAGYIRCFDRQLNPVPYKKGMAEIVILQQAGKAAIKVSRGKLFDDPHFSSALRAAIDGTLRSQGAALPLTAVVASFSTAENPIPKYEIRPSLYGGESVVLINDVEVGQTKKINDYSETAIQTFEENYPGLVAKNVGSLALKMVAATVAAYSAKAAFQTKKGKDRNQDQAIELAGNIAGAAAGFVTGLAMSFTVKPDLRSWHLVPSNYQISRIFVEPGQYNVKLKSIHRQTIIAEQRNLSLEANKPYFITFRSF